MIVQLGHPSPPHEHLARKLYASRSVGTGTRLNLCATISSNMGETLSNAVPFSSIIGPRWNSTLSMAIFGTSDTMVLLSAFAKVGLVSEITNCALVGVISTISIFIQNHSILFVPVGRPSSLFHRAERVSRPQSFQSLVLP